MDSLKPGPSLHTPLQEVLGYLNFSSGSPDPRFLARLNVLFEWIEARCSDEGMPAWRMLGGVLRDHLEELRGSSEAFRNVDQAEAIVRIVFHHALDAYRRWHRDLLFHQSDETLFLPLFIGRMCEAVLAQGAPWEPVDRVVDGAVRQLNDYIGHRPVAVLRTRQKIQPYAHERVRPIPLYVAGAGVGWSRYRELVSEALKILGATDPDLLHAAWFDPEALDELAVDPRAYDFDHPVNRRPNYQFGQWDPHHLDLQGRYRRYVLQQVTLDTMFARVEQSTAADRAEMLFEAAAVLAGTILMGSGISGDRPEAHDSSVSLAVLLPQIAAYRDQFYVELLERLEGKHGRRLRAEAKKLKQPFGGARQHLNRELARRRACQLQHVHLAQIFARIGDIESATRQARIIPGASARMRCELNCRLTTAHLAIDRRNLDGAAAVLGEIEDLLHRAIECGALVDPWNILGFGGHFSIFPAVENSVHDQRVEELIDLISRIFELAARLAKESAAGGRKDLEQSILVWLEKTAAWWDQFASTEVSGVQGISGRETWQSAVGVARALGAWHEAGTAAGDVAFWQGHVEAFHSPKAYALVVEALLEQHDRVAAMALLVQWLSQADEIALVEETYSFHRLAVRWMQELWHPAPERALPGAPASPSQPDLSEEEKWTLARKFLDFVWANAGEYGEVPGLEIGPEAGLEPPEEALSVEEDEEDESGGLFGAAYEGVTYRDTTDDGFEGEMLEWGDQSSDFELAVEGERILHRLAFWNTISRLWKGLAAAPAPSVDPAVRDQVLDGWFFELAGHRRRLARLLAQVQRYPIPPPRSTHDAMVEYDRRREIKESLLDRIISCCVEMADAGWMLLAHRAGESLSDDLEDWERVAVLTLRAIVRDDRKAVHRHWSRLCVGLLQQPLLYVPTARGGAPETVLASQKLQRVLRRLLSWLPRLGMLQQTVELISIVREMERTHPVGHGAITEFDRLFDTGFRAMVRCVVASSATWKRSKGAPASDADDRIVDSLDTLSRPLLQWWLEHSRAIRLSPMEAVRGEKKFRELCRFIQTYGGDWFQQQFMNYGNLRAILLQGVDDFLESLAEEPEAGPLRRLVEDLPDPEARHEAARWLELTLDAVVEHYGEYMDYNSTTTQSDRGEMLYTLLDFLRVLASYERVQWNLKPLASAHEVLIREGRAAAAELWREAIVEQTHEIADSLQQRYEKLCRKYGMRLASVADRLNERFVRPLAVDRLRSLVLPAIREIRAGGKSPAFDQLADETSQMAEEPSGVGLEVPEWLESLAEEVEVEVAQGADPRDTLAEELAVKQRTLSYQEIQKQIARWE